MKAWLKSLKEGLLKSKQNNQLEDWQTYQKLGELRFEEEKYEEAEAYFHQAIEIDENSFLSYRSLAQTSFKLQKWQASETAYRQAIRCLGRGSVFLYRQLGATLAQQQRWPEAIEVYLQSEALVGDIPEELEAARVALQEQSETWETYLQLYDLLGDRQQWIGAIAAWWEAVMLAPEQYWGIRSRPWELSQNLDYLPHLERRFREYIQENPHDLKVYLSLVKALSYQGKTAEEIAVLKILTHKQAHHTHPHLFGDDVPGTRPTESDRLDFAIIGTQKGGTSSLWSYLRCHPNIYLCYPKELHFWSLNFEKGLAWYLAHFPPIPKGKLCLTGEASPTYLNSSNAARRLHDTFPELKIVVLLRDPVDRAISHYYHWRRLHREFRTLPEAIDDQLQHIPDFDDEIAIRNHYVARGCYVEFLERWLQYFPRERCLILQTEAFQQNSSSVVQSVHRFLGVDELPLDTDERRNVGNYDANDEAVRSRLSQYYASYNERLYHLLGTHFDWA